MKPAANEDEWAGFENDVEPPMFGAKSSFGEVPSTKQHQINVLEQIMRGHQRISSYSSFSGNATHQRHMRAQIAQVADNYLQRGSVFVKGLSAVDEVKALQKLRDFLADYGDILNFTNPIWTRIIIVIYGPRVDIAGGFAQRPPKPAPRPYKVEMHHNRFVVDIPSKFRAQELLSFLHKEIPATFVV